MLLNVQIKDFRSYKDATLPLAPLTVLIGANASGKSNALEALRLLSWVAEGNKLNAIKYAVQEQNRAVRGRVKDLPYRGQQSFTLSCEGDFSSGSSSPYRWSHFTISLAASDDDELYIVDERVTSKDTDVPLYQVHERPTQIGHDLTVAYNNFARGGIKPKVSCMDQQAVFIQLESSARYGTRHRMSSRIIPFVSRRLQDWLGGIRFLDPSPSAMRDYGFITDSILNQDGSNISGVLFNICEIQKQTESVLRFVKSLPEQDIDHISFIDTPRGEVMVELTETFGHEQITFDASLLSDGTLRVLAVAAVMLSAPEGSLVVIEEIDNGVHPTRASDLLQQISTLALRRNLRVLISSHNPALLDSLPDDAVPNVVFCYRSPSTGASEIIKLEDLPNYPELIGQGSLGHLLTAGVIDRFVKTQELPDDKKRRSLKWLKHLEKSTG